MKNAIFIPPVIVNRDTVQQMLGGDISYDVLAKASEMGSSWYTIRE